MIKNISTNFSHRFLDQDYLPVTGILEEKKLLGVNHICIHDDCTIFNNLVLPYGAKDIEQKTTAVIDEIFQEIIHILQAEENQGRKIIICGQDIPRRMLGRKLEDRLKREVEY